MGQSQRKLDIQIRALFPDDAYLSAFTNGEPVMQSDVLPRIGRRLRRDGLHATNAAIAHSLLRSRALGRLVLDGSGRVLTFAGGPESQARLWREHNAGNHPDFPKPTPQEEWIVSLMIQAREVLSLALADNLWIPGGAQALLMQKLGINLSQAGYVTRLLHNGGSLCTYRLGQFPLRRVTGLATAWSYRLALGALAPADKASKLRRRRAEGRPPRSYYRSLEKDRARDEQRLILSLLWEATGGTGVMPDRSAVDVVGSEVPFGLTTLLRRLEALQAAGLVIVTKTRLPARPDCSHVYAMSYTCSHPKNLGGDN